MQESLSLWSSTLGLDKKYGFLTAGQSYRVVQPFIDFDKCVHLAGEQCQFVGTSFLARDDGRTWYVSIDGAALHKGTAKVFVAHMTPPMPVQWRAQRSPGMRTLRHS
jgi:hypothetical protein